MKDQESPHFKHLAKHIKKLNHCLEEYRENHGSPHKIGEAYKKICKDTESDNRFERELARSIIDKFQNFNLKVGPKGHHHTAHSFLQAYYSGKITDEKMIEKGMDGVCSNLGLIIMKLCNTESIEKLYKQKD